MSSSFASSIIESSIVIACDPRSIREILRCACNTRPNNMIQRSDKMPIINNSKEIVPSTGILITEAEFMLKSIQSVKFFV